METHSGTELQLRTRKRVTRRLIPYLMFTYLLAYLDRANLSVAKLHMEAALGFSDAVIGFGAGVFFLGYLLLNIPATLLVERWSARKLIGQIMIAWGAVASLMGLLGMRVFGFVAPTTQFYALRLVLGIAEAGFFPGVIVYLSHWYRPEDRSAAKGYFMLAQPLAIAFGVPASGWVLDHVYWAGMASWRWIFILEGLPPLILGFVSFFYLIDRPQHAAWLAADEKRWLLEQLKADEARKTSAHRVSIMDALRYPQTFLLTAILFLIVSGNQALIFFLPSITNTFSGLPAGLRTAAAGLPYACSAVGIVTNGIWARRTGNLKRHTVVPIFSTGISVALAVLAHNHSWLATAFFCAAGLTAQAYMPSFWTLPTTLLGKSAAATAVGVICLGNLGGFFGPWLFGYLKTVTGSYQIGLFVLSGCMIAAGLLATRIPASYAVEEVVSR